jgi:hypothetical protein
MLLDTMQTLFTNHYSFGNNVNTAANMTATMQSLDLGRQIIPVLASQCNHTIGNMLDLIDTLATACWAFLANEPPSYDILEIKANQLLQTVKISENCKHQQTRVWYLFSTSQIKEAHHVFHQFKYNL